MAGERVERRLAAVLAADVAGYSRLMGADELGTLEALKALRREVIDPSIAEYKGRLVKTTGDGLLVEFASAVDAVTCAMAIQETMAGRGDKGSSIRFRIGINVGDLIIDGDDILGDGVNLAARVETECQPGGVCLSDDAFRQIRGKTSFAFDDLGERSLKNIDRPVRLYAARTASSPSVSIAPGVRTATPLALPDRPSVAVLPFQNMSGDPEQDYFADGMVEEIITALSRFKSMFVIARNSSFTYKGKAVDIRQVGRELGVRYVLEGSVRKSGNRVRITGQLIEAATDAHLWADRFEGSLENIFDLQDQVASAVVGAIDPRILEAEIARTRRKQPDSLDAYDCFLRAMDLVYTWKFDESVAALRLLDRAIELDPEYAQAYALACWCYLFRYQLGASWSDGDRQEALRLATQAARLGRDDAFSLAWAGQTQGMLGQLAEGARLMDRALALNPNLARIWNLSGWIRIWQMQPAIAIEHFDRAMRLDPLDPAAHAVEAGIAYAHIRLENYDEALRWAERSMQSHPTVNAERAIAICKASTGDLDGARAAVKRLLKINPAASLSTLPPLLYVSPDFHAHVTGALRRAGLPD